MQDFSDIVNLYTVVGGIAVVLLTYIHGLMFIQLKTDGQIRERANQQAKKSTCRSALLLSYLSH